MGLREIGMMSRAGTDGTRSITNQPTVTGGTFPPCRRPLCHLFLLLSHLSADSVEREAGAKALARISPGRIRHPQIACFALLRPLLRELP